MQQNNIIYISGASGFLGTNIVKIFEDKKVSYLAISEKKIVIIH